ncbi:unclassified [Brachyspira pilosicoli]|nr:unclassified [Brachyspira pilosicoli]
MELKELESKIQTLLKNENIKIKIEDNNFLFIYLINLYMK